MHRLAPGRRLPEGHTGRDDGIEDGDPAAALGIALLAQLAGNAAGIARAVHPVDDPAQRPHRRAQRGHGAQPLQHGQGAAREFPRRQDLGRDRTDQQVGGQHGGVLQRPHRALGVHHDEVVTPVEAAQEVAQTHPAVRGVQDPVLQPPLGIVGDHDVEACEVGAADGALGAGIDDQAGEPAGREVRDGVIAGAGGLRVGIDQQHALADVRQERGQIGRQRGLADPAFG